MMKKISFILSIAIMFLVLSCTEPETPMEIQSLNVSELEILDINDNILLKNISFVTEENFDCQIEYWKEKDKSDLRVSQISKYNTHHSINIAIMEEGSKYNYQIVAYGKNTIAYSDTCYYTTDIIDDNISWYIDDFTVDNYQFDGYLLYTHKTKNYSIMINSDAKIVWYHIFDSKPGQCSYYNPHSQTITYMYGNGEESFCVSNIACIDIFGNEIMNKNMTNLKNNMLHHDAYQLRNGNHIYLNFLDKEYDFSPIGLNEVKNIRSDGFTILDTHGNLVEEWSSFDHINPLEDPNILAGEGVLGIRPVIADFLHANSLGEDKNGDLYLTLNRVDQLWKIDRNTGKVLYRVGQNGNVKISDEAIPTNLHSVSILENNEVMFFENGASDRGYSRVLSYKVDEINMTAELIKNIKLPENLQSKFQGSVYLLDQDHLVIHATNRNRTGIIDFEGNIVWSLDFNGTSFRAQYIKEIN